MLTVFGLLYIANSREKIINLEESKQSQSIEIYIKNAILLNNSLVKNNLKFILLTNNREYINNLLDKINQTMEVKEIDFTLNVPLNIIFYSAHFKIDAFNYISKQNLEYALFCDLDMVCINPLDEPFINLINTQTPICYDITDQIHPAFGSHKVIKDILNISCQVNEGRWFGGEFLGGNSNFFRQIYETILQIYPNYIKNINSMLHIGDEALTSSAILILQKKGIYIADVGILGIVGRYWSVATLHEQKSWKYFKNAIFIHLPADKTFLADSSLCEDYSNNEFIARYSKRVYKRSIIYKTKFLLKELF